MRRLNKQTGQYEFFGKRKHPVLKKHFVKQQVDEDWVKKNFGPKYLEKLYSEKYEGKFVGLPVGAPGDAVVQCPPVIHGRPMPMCRYLQRDVPACIYFSLANALYFLDFPKSSGIIATTGYANAKKKTAPPKKQFGELIQMMKKCCKPLQYTVPLKEDDDIFAVDWNSFGSTYIAVFVPTGSDNFNTHAVAMTKGYVFDSGLDRAVPFEKLYLDQICSSLETNKIYTNANHVSTVTFESINCGVVFMQNPMPRKNWTPTES